MPWHHAIVLYLWLSEVLLVLTLLSAPEHCYGQALPAVRFLAALGASADNNGIYSSLDTNLLPAGSVVLQALSPLQSTAIRLCNISIIGSPRGSTLDISAAQGQLDIFRLATGCTGVLSNLSVRIREFVYASGHRSPVRAFALHPALRVEPGAQLVLRNVSIIQDRFPAGFASDLCATWNHSATTVLDALGTLRVLGQQGTDTGLLLWNTSIFSANTTAAGAAMPCHAVVVGSEAQLQDTFTTSLIPRKRLYISLTRSMALSSANWVPISMPDETPVALLGDPGRATEIDFGGMLAFLIMADGFSMVGGITMSDLTLVNMVSWDAPVSMSSALVSFVPPIFVRRTGTRLLVSNLLPQLLCTRCIMYVPAAEVAWLRVWLPRLDGFNDSYSNITDPSWWSLGDTHLSLHASQVQLLDTGISVGTLSAMQGIIGLSNSQILPVAAYPGHSRLHPAADTWLPQVLLGLPDGASTPLGSTSWPRRYREVLTSLAHCLYGQRPSALMILGDLLTAAAWDTTVDTNLAAHQLAYSKALASGSISGMQLANCSLGTLPNPSGMPREHGSIKLPEYVYALARHNIYEALAADEGWLSVFDMLGTVGALEFPPDHTISIGRIMLVNLAPGGYVFDWVTSSMVPVAGWAEAQGSLAAGFANQSLPIWWAQADRSSHVPVLQLNSVTLVVAPEELELVQALLAAVLALRAVGKLVAVIGTSSSPILFPAAFLNSVPSLASAGGQGLPPHMRLMLAHAAGWQLSNETATSLTFRRWSYLGVQGEGVIITSQWPMGQSMPSGKPPLAHVPAAGAGMSALKRELERRVELLQTLDDDKLPTAKSTSTYGPSPLSAAAPVPVSGSKTTQGSHTTTTAQPASITSQGSNQQHHVLVACLAAGGGLAFIGAVLYAFITLRRKRQRAGQGVYVVKDGSAPLPTTHAYLLHTSLGSSMSGPWAGALQEMQAAAHQLNESLDLGSNVLKPPGAPYKQPAKELAPKGFLNFRAFGSGLWVWPEQGGAVRTATSSARRGPKSIASPEFVISPQSQGYDLGQLQLGSVLTCSANSAVYVGHWRLLPVAVKVRRVCIDDPPSGKSPHTASAAAVKAGQEARCDTKAWREGQPFLRDLLAEVKAAASLCHPNVIACLGYDIKDARGQADLQSCHHSATAWDSSRSGSRSSASMVMLDSASAAMPVLETLPVIGPTLKPVLEGASCTVLENGSGDAVEHAGSDIVEPAFDGPVRAGLLQHPQQATAAGVTVVTWVRGDVPMTPANTAQPLDIVLPSHGTQPSTFTGSAGSVSVCASNAAWLQHGNLLPPMADASREDVSMPAVCEVCMSSLQQAAGAASSHQLPEEQGASILRLGSGNTSSVWQVVTVTEYCDGGSLQDYVDAASAARSGCTRPPWSLICGGAGLQSEELQGVLLLAWQVAAGMAYCHARELVHGALCPSNILLHCMAGDDIVQLYRLAGYNGSQLPRSLASSTRLVKILHVASSMHQHEGARACLDGLRVAPEVVCGAQASAAGDVYAFGVLLLELWYGQPAERIAAMSGGSLLHGLQLGADPLTFGSAYQAKQAGVFTGDAYQAVSLEACLCGKQPGRRALEVSSSTVALSWLDSDSSSYAPLEEVKVECLKAGSGSSWVPPPQALCATLERCLHEHVHERPSFTELQVRLRSLLDSSVHLPA